MEHSKIQVNKTQSQLTWDTLYLRAVCGTRDEPDPDAAHDESSLVAAKTGRDAEDDGDWGGGGEEADVAGRARVSGRWEVITVAVGRSVVFFPHSFTFSADTDLSKSTFLSPMAWHGMPVRCLDEVGPEGRAEEMAWRLFYFKLQRHFCLHSSDLKKPR